MVFRSLGDGLEGGVAEADGPVGEAFDGAVPYVKSIRSPA